MRRSTTSVGTERLFLAILLAVELAVSVVLLSRPTAVPPASAVPTATRPTTIQSATNDPTTFAPTTVAPTTSTDAATVTDRVRLRDGRTAELTALGGATTVDLAVRIAGELDDAADAVTAFWGDDWRRDVVIVATGTDEQFAAFGAGGADIAAATTSHGIVFAPGAAAMSPGSLRVVLRHELFHYAVRPDTAADAPRWLTEGVADFVGRPSTPLPGPGAAAELARLPTDADLDTEGVTRSLAYDRAWWFSRFVADRYGTDALRRLYLAACGNGHTDMGTAVRDTLGSDLVDVLAAWRQWLGR